MSVGESYGRHRVDRSLDEIAAEMNSGNSSAPFGEEYEERDFIGAPIRGGSSSSNRRSAPYSLSSRNSYRERDRASDRFDRNRSPDLERDKGNRVFVSNLSYHTSWQALKDHMRKGV